LLQVDTSPFFGQLLYPRIAASSFADTSLLAGDGNHVADIVVALKK
jgi:hypothetical protein